MTRTQPADAATVLLQDRELQALKVTTAVRAALVLTMAPLVWWLGTSWLDRVATFSLLAIYALTICSAAYLISRRRRLRAVGLSGVGLDVMIIAALPFIWYTTLGGAQIPAGVTLKTSVTAISILFIASNALAMRPLYPLLATAGSLLVHFGLVALSLMDDRTVFTHSYLAAYTTADVSIGRVVTAIVVVALVGAMLTLLTARARKMIFESAQLQKSNVQLGRYFSPNLVPKLTQNTALFEVGGERRDLSFVFTDLEGFTSLVETNEPAVVVPLLNGYLDELVQVAFKHEGTVDKIVGDALHVMFGAPVTQPDHAQRAIACALDMDASAQRYRRRAAQSVSLGVTRIGVNSGLAVVGNFGGDALFDYTAHGDAINTAARLEAANKYFGTRVCVSADTVARVPGFFGRPIGRVWMQGKSQGIDVFEPLLKDRMPASDLEAYLEAYQSLRLDRSDALSRFADLCQSRPEDPLVRFHAARLRTGQSGVEIVLDSK